MQHQQKENACLAALRDAQQIADKTQRKGRAMLMERSGRRQR